MTYVSGLCESAVLRSTTGDMAVPCLPPFCHVMPVYLCQLPSAFEHTMNMKAG
jgi:hypothetical protein